MEHPDEFQKILRRILSQEPNHTMTEEEIHFDVLDMEVMELVSDSYVVWLN